MRIIEEAVGRLRQARHSTVVTLKCNYSKPCETSEEGTSSSRGRAQSWLETNVSGTLGHHWLVRSYYYHRHRHASQVLHTVFLILFSRKYVSLALADPPKYIL